MHLGKSIVALKVSIFDAVLVGQSQVNSNVYVGTLRNSRLYYRFYLVGKLFFIGALQADWYSSRS